MDQLGLLPTQQVCLTTDNGSNILAAARSLDWVRLSCFGHNLHLAITKAIAADSRCARAIGLGHKIVNSFSLSWKRRKALTKAQLDLNLPCRSLVADCKTRWGTTHKMLERLLEQEAALKLVLSGDRKTTNLVPTWQDIDVWGAINDALSPLAAFTDIMSGMKNNSNQLFFCKPICWYKSLKSVYNLYFTLAGEKYITGSAIIPIMNLLSDKILQENDENIMIYVPKF